MSDAIFEKLFECSPGAIIVLNADGEIVRVNARAESVFGYRRTELLGRPFTTLLPERFRELSTVYHREASGKGVAQAGVKEPGWKIDGLRKDGEEFPAELELRPVEADGRRLIMAMVREIAEPRREENPCESMDSLHLLVDAIEDYAIYTLDTEGRVTSWNKGAERVKGYCAKEVIGQDFARFFPSEDVLRGKPGKQLRLAAAQGRYEEEGWRVRKDGSRFWASVVVTSLRDEAGQLRGFVKVTRDITERRQAEEAVLLELTDVLLSNLDVQKLFVAVSGSISSVVANDYAALTIYERETNKLRVHRMVSLHGVPPPRQDKLLALDETVAGWVFGAREPVVLNRMDTDRFPRKMLQDWLSLGLRSGCWLPLIHRGNILGVLIVASEQEDVFAEKQIRLLTRVANQVAIALDNALAFRQIGEAAERLINEKRYLEDELKTEYNFEEIVGESEALRRVLKQVETVASTDATVLILGETGTGKELIARAIHNLSARRERTFVKLNCAAIPTGLLESELFGHERGAFTGAIARKIGRLELANGGTFFLDEFGDIPLDLQPKLLRALQEKEFERLGSTRTIPVDFRLVAATNRNLVRMVKDGRFRRDLYYRLNVFPISVPPLRNRREDIPLLAYYFVQKHSQRMDKRIETIPPQALQALARWHWPGNVRELENLIERAVILTQGPTLRIPLAELKPAEEPAPAVAPSTLEGMEREHILHALREAHGVIGGPKGAASRLGLKRTTLAYKMQKLGITRQSY